MGRADRQLGDKLGPRLVQLAVQAVVAARRSLAPHEAKVHAAATQRVIDQAGREIADLYAPILDKLTEGQALPEWLDDHLAEVKSGEHQWKAIAGVLGMSGAMTPISVALNNFLAAGVRELVALDPLLVPDVGTLAQLSNMGHIPAADALFAAQGQGINGKWFTALELAAQSLPSMAEIQDMANRGIISDFTALSLLQRVGAAADIVDQWYQLKEALLPPADAALAVLRGNMPHETGVKLAASAGYSAADFEVMIGNTGEPPAMEEMLSLWRRGMIDTATLDKAILQSRVRDEWVPFVHMMGVVPPTPAEALNALLQGQIPRREAETRYQQGGGDPTWFQAAFDSEGSAPTPVQASIMANRQIIPWDGTGPAATSYAQAFLEGPWRNKWSGPFRKMAQYYPPPREISTLVKEGGLTQDQAMKMWEQEGLTPQTALLYWKAAHYQKTATSHHLAVSNIEHLYHDQAITEAEAKQMLAAEGWTDTDASYMLEIVDLQRERSYIERAISKVSGLFVSHKIDATAASAALANLGVESGQAGHLIKTWTLERGMAVKTLSASQIADAYYYEIMDQPTAQAALEQMGYTPHDAWLVLSIRLHVPLPGEPK